MPHAPFAPQIRTVHNRRDVPWSLLWTVSSTRKLNSIIRDTTTAPQPPGPELHHGQYFVTVLGHRVIRLLPAVVFDELVGILDTLEGT